MPGYTEKHAAAGLRAKLPRLEWWANQYPGYEITIEADEFTCVCPKTGLPDFGVITIHYEPKDRCVELKSLKMYLTAYRNLGIFNENVVNRVLGDLVKVLQPVWMDVTGDFTPRGGIQTTVRAAHGPVPLG